MIRVAIVEDETSCQEQLSDYLDQFGKENRLDVEKTVFGDGLDIVENYSSLWDIIFMDIRMKHMNGMEAAAKIRKYDKDVLIIFITTMAQYAIKGYEVEALDFVLKPVSYPQFFMKMTKAVNVLEKRKKNYLLLPVEDGKEKVCTGDILFIEVIAHSLHIRTNSRSYTVRGSMQEMEKKLENFHFARCSNSYLVNLENVAGVRKETVLTGEYELPISRGKKKQFLLELSNYLTAGYK